VEIIYFQTTTLKTLHFKEFRLCTATTEYCLQKQAQHYWRRQMQYKYFKYKTCSCLICLKAERS